MERSGVPFSMEQGTRTQGPSTSPPRPQSPPPPKAGQGGTFAPLPPSPEHRQPPAPGAPPGSPWSQRSFLLRGCPLSSPLRSFPLCSNFFPWLRPLPPTPTGPNSHQGHEMQEVHARLVALRVWQPQQGRHVKAAGRASIASLQEEEEEGGQRESCACTAHPHEAWHGWPKAATLSGGPPT